MPADEFWQLIAVLDGSTDEDAVARLTAALRAGGRRTAAAFAERLAATLYELDREVLFDQPVRWSDDPADGEPVPLSGDTFLYLRAAVVAQGREVVEQVLADPAALSTRRWDDGEALLYAAGEAAGKEIDTKVSYETGANDEHWSTDGSEPEPGVAPLVAVLLSDLLQPIEAWAGESMTPTVEYVWPLWFPMDVLETAGDRIDALVRDGGGLPASLEAEQIQIHVGLGDSWRVTPEVGRATDDTGLGEVVEARVEMRQEQVRGWRAAEQEAALLAVIASCCLAVLPGDHGSRDALRQAAAAGAPLLPPRG